MLLRKFRVYNYKSIKDSRECFLEDGVTLLAGKNESGKTSILEALEDFNVGRKIRESAKPLHTKELLPRIELTFEVTKFDVTELTKSLHVEEPQGLPELTTIQITKEYPDHYSIKSDLIDHIVDVASRSSFAQSIGERLSLLSAPETADSFAKLGGEVPSVDLSDRKRSLVALRSLMEKITPQMSSIPESQRSIIKSNVEGLISDLESAGVILQTHGASVTKLVLSFVPSFILFSSFEDVFPNSIPLGKLKENKWISDLQEISDINVDTILSSDEREKKTHKRNLNIKLNQDFKQFWTQDASNLDVDWDNQSLKFWVEEHGEFYPPEIRSQGRRWHLAFYVRVSARAREDVRNIVLIDEPGLYLHAKAQQDVLNSLEIAGKDIQVVFTTHSPYLIEPDKLERIRLVLRNEKDGTTIENKVHKVADKETLTPILTAIGLEMSQSITEVEKANNVVVEGPADYFYLTGLKRLLGEGGLNVVFGGGANNLPVVSTILQGWGCKVVYLTDNDQGGKDAKKNADKNWANIDPEAMMKLPFEGAIEDVFTKTDFKTHVLKDPNAAITGKNSEFVKGKGKDKVLKARLFLSLINQGNNVNLEAQTIANFRSVMNALRRELEKQGG